MLLALEHDDLEMVTELINAGADPRSRCYGGMTIHQYAQYQGTLRQEIKDLIADTYDARTLPEREAYN